MRKYYLGILFITCLAYASSSRPKRFLDYDAHGTNDWNWVSRDQLADAQTPQVNWPKSGNGGSVKGKGESTPTKDSSWMPDTWPPGGNRNDGTDMGWNTQPQGNNKGSAYPDGDEDQEGDLETILRGVPGMDFPNFLTVPDTDFDCSSMPSQGYYGDVEAGCQVFHICQPGNRKDSFLCPVGTIFNQKYFVCDWWFNVNCSDTPSYYELNNEVYKDPEATVTEEVPVTTEKSMPWNPQDLDRKKPTKSKGNQPATGKQNPNWKGTPARRGSKSSGSVSTSREVSNTWGRSDVQKEVTLTWGASSSSPSETYASSSATSNSITPTLKPIWYGIDGQPAKDQSNDVSKRVGLLQSSVPFGTRIRKTKGRSTTKPDEFSISPMTSSSYKPTTPNMRIKENNVDWPSPTTGSWQKIDDTTDSFKTENRITWNNDVDYDYATTKSWVKDQNIPETSINPTGIEGVWEQQTRKENDFETSINPTRVKGVWEQQTTKRMDPETSINPSGVEGVWEQKITKRMDPETSINPSAVKGVWEQKITKRMDPETSINPSGVKGVWEQKITKRMDPETSINPSGVKGVWEQQITKRMDPETSINPTGTKKSIWKQQSTNQFNEDHPFRANMVKNKDFDTKTAHTVQNGRNIKTTPNQRKDWNQRRKFKKVQSSTAANKEWVPNSSQKQRALENSFINTKVRRQNWK